MPFGKPYWLITEDNAEKRLARLSHITRADLLAVLARADIKGRICADLPSVLDNIELFSLVAEDHGCNEGPMAFANDHTRYSYFRGKCASRHDVVFDDTWGEVVVMCGLPGSGKDTWIKNNLDIPSISLDNLRRSRGVSHGDKIQTGRIRQEGLEMARVHLRKKESFVWNATNLQRTRRKPLLDLAVNYGARVRIVYVEASSPNLFNQNKNRDHVVPEAAIRRMTRAWEMPTLTEAHAVDYWVDGQQITTPLWG